MKGFGKDVKPSFTIGERREKRIERTVGPGEYAPERADKITKVKAPNTSSMMTMTTTKSTTQAGNSFSGKKQRTDRQRVRNSININKLSTVTDEDK